MKVRNKFGTTFQRAKHNVKTVRDAISRPVAIDIVFAAGLYQGRGSASAGTIVIRGDEQITVRLLAQFGGSVDVVEKDRIKPIAVGKRVYFATRDVYNWRVSGARARGFAMTIYKFLTIDRQEQIRENILRRLT